MKKKSVLIAILVLLALAVWSHNIYQIVIGVTRADREMDSPIGDESAGLHDTLVAKLAPRPAFAYSGAYRDPFTHWLHLEKKDEAHSYDTGGQTSLNRAGAAAIAFERHCARCQQRAGHHRRSAR